LPSPAEELQLSDAMQAALSDANHPVLALDVALRALHGSYIMPVSRLAGLRTGHSVFHKRLVLPELIETLSRQPRFAAVEPVQGVPLRSALGEGGLLDRWAFRPTEAQRRVVGEIAEHFRRQDDRVRLIQGDVGAGKSAVIASAAAMMLGQAYSTVVCAPTEVLANQLAVTLQRHIAAMLGDGQAERVVRYKTGLSERGRTALLRKQEKHPMVLVGTHGVVTAPISRLGLAVFDEEQRFSSTVKETLRAEHPRSHLLLVSATPIPRTLAVARSQRTWLPALMLARAF
jgi:ATP-dependent DNA helicase RecG